MNAGQYYLTILWLPCEENTGCMKDTHTSKGAVSLPLTHALEERQYIFWADGTHSAYLAPTAQVRDECRYSRHVLSVCFCRVLVYVHYSELRYALTELPF
jgi:hypothetical protein